MLAAMAVDAAMIASPRDVLRRAAWKVVPGVMADRAHRHQRALIEDWGLSALAERIVEAHGDRVLRGPFAGMRYPSGRVGSIPKRIGAYELELHGWFENALAASPARFVDIGSADGFYAVGVATRGVPVQAFEMARSARAEARELAALNGVQLTILGRATVAALKRIDFARALVLSDCEGAEAELLTPGVVARMRTATVIVEVHESVRSGVGALLRERFAPTHDVEVVEPVEHDADAFPELASLDPHLRRHAVSELRAGATPWYRMTPRPRA
jgi:hypothetical protein